MNFVRSHILVCTGTGCSSSNSPKIIETFEESGVPITGLYACGGIAEKNPFAMQIYADVTGKEIRVARSAQSPALGSAMFGAVAAGKAKGGYDSIFEAAKEMGGVKERSFQPVEEHQRVYDQLYAEYSICTTTSAGARTTS